MNAAAIAALLVCLGPDPAASPPAARPASPPTQAADAGHDAILATMKSLHQERRFKELVAQFAREDISAWPAASASQAAEALHLRGQAYAALKDGKQAEIDLKASLRLAPKDGLVWHALAENYAGNLSDDREALAAYRQVVAVTGRTNGWLPINATLQTARILTDRGETDEALRALETYGDARNLAPIWRIRVLRAYGHVYAARGDEPASLAKFREAIELESAGR
jgi:tetratricopeptide (TPR) repeat protein